MPACHAGMEQSEWGMEGTRGQHKTGEIDTLPMGYSIICVKCIWMEQEGADILASSPARVATFIGYKVLPKTIITLGEGMSRR